MSTNHSSIPDAKTMFCTVFLLLAVFSFCGSVLASGGGSYGGGSSNAIKIDSERYALGKNVFRTSVNCDGCLVNKSKLSKSEALALYQQVRKDKTLKSSLSKKERRALKYYMRERFKL